MTYWYPGLFERSNYNSWKKKGALDLAGRATKQVENILAEYKPEPLPGDIAKQIKTVVENG